MTQQNSTTLPVTQRTETNQQIYEFLKHNPVGVIVTCGKYEGPRGSVIYYAVDKDFSVTFTTKRDTKKHINLLASPRTMLVVYEAASQTVVQVEGEAEEIEDTVEANAAFKDTLKASLRTSLSGVPPITKIQAGYYVTYRVKPSRINMAIYSRPDAGVDGVFEFADLDN